MLMADLSPTTVFALSSDVSMQSVGDGAVVLLATSGQMYTCNSTTEAFLRNVDGSRDFAELVRLFCTEFDVDPATAAADLGEIALELVGESILTRS